MKTQLANRILWYDGTNQVDPDLVPSLLLEGCQPEKIVVNELNDDIRSFNLLSDVEIRVGKEDINDIDFEYQIPDSYKNIELEEYFGKFQLSPMYKERVAKELKEIKAREMELLLKTLIYVVDRFKETNTIWGVGRGSSCASLLLYLIDLHSVDPIKYSIPLEEFFHN